jgi:drug/metabolite transporter (DMT)-like permease
MANLIENSSPQRNPMTTWPGILFVALSFVMYAVKYLAPLFFTLKEPVNYSDWIPAIMLFIGLVLLFMTDDLFKQIFGAVLNVFKKKTDTQ